MPPHLFPVIHRPVTLGCRATDVNEHRFRAQLHAPPRPLHAAAEVHLVAEHEEGRVEGADLVDRLASHQEHGAHQEAPLPSSRGQGGAPESAWRRAADGRRAGPPARGHAHHRHVCAAVLGKQPWPQDAGPGVTLGTRHEPRDGLVVLGPRILVHDEAVAPRRRLDPAVRRGPEAHVPGELDQAHPREALADELRAAVR